MSDLRQAADAYVASNGFEHSGGVIEEAFEAGARWATENIPSPYGYVFGGCTFLPNGSPLATEYVVSNSLPVFLQPATRPSTQTEVDRLRRMVERRDEFIIANGLWDAFKEASREAE